MSDSTFDPFDLPSSFDPLGSQSLEPTGQSAYSRHGQPPRRRRQCSTEPATAALPPARPANPRLAHLLPEAGPAGPPGTGPACNDTDTATRLATLEHEVAILTARLDALQAAIDDKLAEHQHRLLRAVAPLLEQQRARR